MFNEEKTLDDVFDKAGEFLDLIVAVDDGSRDGSAEKIRSRMRGRRGMYLLRHEGNRGMARALQTGFLFVQRLLESRIITPDDIVINFDADGQHPVQEIPRASSLMVEDDLDILLMNRDFSLYPRYKVLGNLFLTSVARLVSGYPYQDVESGFRLVRARAIPLILDYFTGWKYSCAQEIAIITALHGLRIRNDYRIRINYYRPGTTVSDGFAVLTMSIVALLRVKLRWRNSPSRIKHALDDVTVEPDDMLEECPA